VLAARFGSLLAKWDGEVNEQFEAKTRVLNRLCRSVVQLQRGMHRARLERLEAERLQEEQGKREDEELQHRLVAPCFDMLKEPAMAKMFGGGVAGRKIAAYVLAVQRGNVFAKLDLSPAGHDEDVAPEPVKPARKRRTGKSTGKTKPHNADKPLETNEKKKKNESEARGYQSESVKVGQTDLAQVGDGQPRPISPLSPISPKTNANSTEL
jgi:hypothetical protein